MTNVTEPKCGECGRYESDPHTADCEVALAQDAEDGDKEAQAILADRPGNELEARSCPANTEEHFAFSCGDPEHLKLDRPYYPADPEGMNQERAELASKALEAFEESNGAYDDDEHETRVSDLLADLMHFADRNGIDWEFCLANANTHYLAETDPNGPRGYE